MLRTVFTKSLRDYRWAIGGWGIGLGVLVFAQYALFRSTVGNASPVQSQHLVQQFQFFGEAVRVDTPGGFTTFKIMGLLPVILGVWTVLAGARLTRGDEEQGSLSMVLSTPHSRLSVIGQELLALAAATALISLAIASFTVGGMAAAHVALSPAAALAAAGNAGLAAFLFGALSLFLAQITDRAPAAGWAGGLMALCYVLDGTGRAAPAAAGLRRLSPFYYYNLSLPLVPGYWMNWPAFALLAGLFLLFSAAAIRLFVQRDIGRSVLADLAFPRRSSAARTGGSMLWERTILLHTVRRQAGTMIWWIAALGLFTGYMVVVAKTSEREFQKLLSGSSFVKQVFGGTNLATNNGFLSALLFRYVPLVIALFAMFLAARWAADLDAGRMELVLVTPQPRSRVILERYAAVAVAVILAVLCVWLVLLVVARAGGLSVDAGTAGGASVGMAPLALLTASLLFAPAGALHRATIVGLTTVFLGVSFLGDIVKSLLNLPDWAVNLSIFYQYGTPMVNGLNWAASLTMLAIAAALLGAGTWRFCHGDVERGSAEA